MWMYLGIYIGRQIYLNILGILIYLLLYVCVCVWARVYSCVYMLCECLCIYNWISEESVRVFFNHSLLISLSEGFFRNIGLLPRLGWARANSSNFVSISPWSWITVFFYCFFAWHLRVLESELQPGCGASSTNRWAISLVCYLNILRKQLMPAAIGFGRPDAQEVWACRPESEDKRDTLSSFSRDLRAFSYAFCWLSDSHYTIEGNLLKCYLFKGQ